MYVRPTICPSYVVAERCGPCLQCRAAHVFPFVVCRHRNITRPSISEETENLPYEERRDFQYCWVVDPLDGTKVCIIDCIIDCIITSLHHYCCCCNIPTVPWGFLRAKSRLKLCLSVSDLSTLPAMDRSPTLPLDAPCSTLNDLLSVWVVRYRLRRYGRAPCT